MASFTRDSLRERVRGSVIGPDDPGYDDARAVYNGMIDKRPVVVVSLAQVADVMTSVTFAREHELPVAVRGGGHSTRGFGTVDGGLVLDFTAQNGVRVDPATETARSGPRATWADFNHATHAFGLATTGGIIGSTGVSGLTLCGGIGYLSRQYGLSCDKLLSAEVVTADGRFLVATETESRQARLRHRRRLDRPPRRRREALAADPGRRARRRVIYRAAPVPRAERPVGAASAGTASGGTPAPAAQQGGATSDED